MKTRRLGLSTRAIHGVPETRPPWTPVVPPIFQSSTFTNPNATALGIPGVNFEAKARRRSFAALDDLLGELFGTRGLE